MVERQAIFGSADFSSDGLRRRRLDRWWEDGPRALYCMANPSDAGIERNDPTVLQIVGISRRCGYPGLTVVNASDRVASDAKAHERWRSAMQWNQPDDWNAIFEANLALIRAVSTGAAIRIVAWGNLVPAGREQNAVLAALSHDGAFDLYALGFTQDGVPKHPLARGKHRLAADVVPVLWRSANPNPNPDGAEP